MPERYAGRQAGPPRFPDNPLSLCPVLRPRQDRPVRPCDVVGTAPAMSTTKAPTTIHLSGLNSTALRLAVYASSKGSLHPTQNSLPVAGQALPGRIGYLQGSNERFQTVVILPSQVILAQGRSTQTDATNRLVEMTACAPRAFACAKVGAAPTQAKWKAPASSRFTAAPASFPA